MPQITYSTYTHEGCQSARLSDHLCTEQELIEMIREMDEDDSGTVDFEVGIIKELIQSNVCTDFYSIHLQF